MSHAMLTADQRSTLLCAKGVTLDGKPAGISSPYWGIVHVTQTNIGRFIELTWPETWRTVKRNGGQFYSW